MGVAGEKIYTTRSQRASRASSSSSSENRKGLSPNPCAVAGWLAAVRPVHPTVRVRWSLCNVYRIVEHSVGRTVCRLRRRRRGRRGRLQIHGTYTEVPHKCSIATPARDKFAACCMHAVESGIHLSVHGALLFAFSCTTYYDRCRANPTHTQTQTHKHDTCHMNSKTNYRLQHTIGTRARITRPPSLPTPSPPPSSLAIYLFLFGYHVRIAVQ